MARTRLIKPGFFLNDELAELPPLDRLLFVGLWTIADREGRLNDRPRTIKASVIPYDKHPIEKALARLASGKFIIRYSVGGVKYIQIQNFTKHQHPHIKEHQSTIPAPYESGATSGLAPDKPVLNKDTLTLNNIQEPGVVVSGDEAKNREALIAQGVSPATADRLATDYLPERVQAVLKACTEQQPRNPAGWIVGALEDNWDLNKPPEKLGGRVMPTPEQLKARRKRDQEHQEKAAQEEIEHKKRVAEIEATDPDGWKKAKDIIHQELRKACPALKTFPVRIVETKALELCRATEAESPKK